jgi:hypothetical protein
LCGPKKRRRNQRADENGCGKIGEQSGCVFQGC